MRTQSRLEAKNKYTSKCIYNLMSRKLKVCTSTENYAKYTETLAYRVAIKIPQVNMN